MTRPPARPVLFEVCDVGIGPFMGWSATAPRRGGCGELRWSYLFTLFPGPLVSKTTPTGRQGFRAVEVRVTAEGRATIVRESVFRLRWKAKDRAWRWYCDRVGCSFSTWHVTTKRTKRQKAAIAARSGLENVRRSLGA